MLIKKICNSLIALSLFVLWQTNLSATVKPSGFDGTRNLSGAEQLKNSFNEGKFGLHSALFTENKGQVYGYDGLPHPEVKFVLQQGATQIFLLEKGIAYQFTRMHYPAGYHEVIANRAGPENFGKLDELREQIRTETFRMDMTLVGANPDPRITKEGKSADYVNYYNHDVLNVHQYNKITYHDIYPGIDWVIYSKDGKVKYDFVVRPGADPSLIKMEYDHHDELKLNNDGSFTLKSSLGSITEERPLSFQENRSVETAFSLEKNVITFSLDNYDPKKQITIDPVLLWATYYGGSGDDVARSCATDVSGNVYISGYTGSTGNIASGGHQNTLGGIGSFFLVKFNGSGIRQWGTYYGSVVLDNRSSCATDGVGNVYLAGTTGSTANIAFIGHQNVFGGGTRDAFLVKFNSAGILQWGTYYGGSNDDYGNSCATDGSGNVYLAGGTASTFNIGSGGHQNTHGGGTFYAYLVKFNGNGVRQWGTYYGGNSGQNGYSCATDGSGNVYLSGYTGSTINIASGGHQNTFGGGDDAFLVKFNGSGIRQWGTYYGDSWGEYGSSCATDGLGNVYLAGNTTSAVNIAFGGHQNTIGGGSDGFLIKFNAGGVRQWGTYYGDAAGDYGYSCTTDESGNVYLAGMTTSTNNIAFGGYQNTYAGGNCDAFLVKFNGNGVRRWGTYYGGIDDDFGYSCVTDGLGNIYLAGNSNSPANIASAGHQNTFGGGNNDAILIKFCNPPEQPSAITGNTLACTNRSQLFGVVTDTSATSYNWSLPSGWNGTSNTNSISLVPLSSGVLSVTAISNCGSSQTQTLHVTVDPGPQISIVSSESVFCTGMTVTLTASGAQTYTWNSGSNNPEQVVNPTSATVYTVTGSSVTNCSNSVIYTLQPIMAAAFNFTISGLTASLSLVSACNSFIWDYGNGGGSGVNPNPVVTYSSPGDYIICAKCNGFPNECTQCVSIKLPNNYSGGVGLPETKFADNPLIFPNPGSGDFRIVLPENTRVSIQIVDNLGKVIFDRESVRNDDELSLENRSGIFSYRITTKDGDVSSGKLIIY